MDPASRRPEPFRAGFHVPSAPVTAFHGDLAGSSGELRVVDPRGDAAWDEKVARAFPAATTFFERAWAEVLVETYGYLPLYLQQESAGEIRQLLPLCEVDSWMTGKRGVSLPFTDACPALGATPAGADSLYQSLFRLGRERGWRYVEVRGSPPRLAADVPSVSFHGHTLALGRSPAELFSGFDSAVRRAVRKAENEGVTVAFETSLAAVRIFYHLLRKTRTRHGLPPQPWRFFAAIHRHIIARGKGSIVIARHRENPVAAAVFFTSGRHVLYKFSASDETHQQVRGNNLVIWRAIERYNGEGFLRLDFGRTSLGNEGLRRFKLSWGTAEHALHYYRYDLRTGAVIATPDKASEGLHTRMFRALPQPLTRLIGAAAYKHLG